MDSNKSQGKFLFGRQSSMAPERDDDSSNSLEDLAPSPSEIEEGVRLMFLANEGDLEGITEMLDSGVDVNFKDIDSRTPLHIASCQGLTDVVKLLLERGAEVGPKDRWGSTPLADAIHYKNQDVIKLLEKHGAKYSRTPMHVQNDREIPEYEINPREIDFSNSIDITKGTFRMASWRGIDVAVKTLGDDVLLDEEKVKAFTDELALLQKIRHPNVVQFLGAVTQSSPMMIITEYLPKGDLHAFLKRKGALKPLTTVKFALDIARGMNYLHENRPAIIHRDLEPSNILRDISGHLKVADFGVSKLLKVSKTVREHGPLSCQETSWRYVAPEVFKNEEYDTKVDVFSFSLIVQEMIEGYPPFVSKSEEEAAKAYSSNERPPFGAPAKYYAHGLQELIDDCWNHEPFNRPTFRQIISRLESIEKVLERKRRLKSGPFGCFRLLEKMRKRGHTNSDSSTSIVR
ncbi:integrin-linked protein kinase 1-like isoform X2 [Amaranthus tricolor]|uniref:integrin-linked protein kinase 1-like isoform X2 n=1 Tax=Amaranthus tricolor TaxID=29722 RepID=UPI00258EDA49|nr:integrin-linked protein kinase 1-like isoform X2 [Amaranthus tricolor]